MNDAGMQAGMSQRMAATASMQLGVQVLQANSMELGRIIQQALEKNPVLELEGPENYIELTEPAPEAVDHDQRQDDWEANLRQEYGNPDAVSRRDFFFNSLTEEKTLAAFLHEQAQESTLPPKTVRALSILIDSLDLRGFFEEPPEDIAERLGIRPPDLRKALDILQDMEPYGVGARNLQDSLIIQLRHAGESSSIAARLVENCWEDIVKHRYEAAAKYLGVTVEDVSIAMERIAKLNPDPGDRFSHGVNPILTPDLVVEKDDGGNWEVHLTSEYVPRLKLSDYYKDALSEHYDDADLRVYLKKAFKDGRDLINAVSQRQETILMVAKAIVNRQQAYFDNGPKHLKPLNMATLADELGMHVSTISRAVAGKYLLSKWGYKELRSFFTSSIAVEGQEQDADMSSAAVHELIREIIDNENKGKPLSDAAIARQLEGRGLNIARRTVAKYREQMKILPASLRRTI